MLDGKLFFPPMFDVFVVLSPALLRFKASTCQSWMFAVIRQTCHTVFLTHTALPLVLKFYRESEREGRGSERGGNRNKYFTLTKGHKTQKWRKTTYCSCTLGTAIFFYLHHIHLFLFTSRNLTHASFMPQSCLRPTECVLFSTLPYCNQNTKLKYINLVYGQKESGHLIILPTYLFWLCMS